MSIALGSWGVAGRVLHVIVVLGSSSCYSPGPCSLQLGIGLIALGQGVDKLVRTHIHGEAFLQQAGLNRTLAALMITSSGNYVET